jgi:uncharacterized YccA/Bax inhibitor family protein
MTIAPYGYTLSVWTSGAVLTHAEGVPSSVDALLFMLGAVAGFATVVFIAFGDLRERVATETSRPRLWSGLHVLSISAAIAAVTVIPHLLEGVAVWPLGGFVATAVYLVVLAAQVTVAN